MKQARFRKIRFLLLPLSISPFFGFAQQHQLYGDVGLSLAYFNPGFSATYNYQWTPHFGLGAGV